jgi:hypothetical protein
MGHFPTILDDNYPASRIENTLNLNPMRWALLLLLLFAVPSFQAMRSADYDSCHSDLNDLKERSDNAASKAEDASDAETKLQHCRDDDDDKSGCGSELSAYGSAKDDLESALGDVASKVSSASSSCGFDIGKAPTLESIKARYCTVLNRQRGIMPFNILFTQCKQTLSDEECKRCLGIK